VLASLAAIAGASFLALKWSVLIDALSKLVFIEALTGCGKTTRFLLCAGDGW
jgi:hypothetical protein